MTDEEIEEMCEQERCEQMERIDLNMFFNQDINQIPLEIKKDIHKIKELIECGN